MSTTTRIARNTLALYFRQILIMLVSLYSVRVVLATLGTEDYGIYNVVAGVVAMFGFLSNSMATATQRYLSFELGQGDMERLRRVFSISLTIYILIAGVVLLLAETVGLWFVSNMLVIPPERKSAALWVYHCVLVSFVFTMLTIPYMAAIIAHEDMRIYAYVSIVETALRLGIAVVLAWAAWDKLKLYGLLMCAVTCVNTSVYRTICAVKYRAGKFRFYWNKTLFKEMTALTGWTLFGNIAGVARNQGINILLNIYFGPLVNAARAVAIQVNSAVLCFAQGFSTAMRPHITKLYAVNDIGTMIQFVFRAVKLTAYLLLFFMLPLQLELASVLRLWLGEIPEHTLVFIRIILIETMLESVSYPINGAWIASGKVRTYQVISGGIILLNVPVALLLLRTGRVSSSGVLLLSAGLSFAAFTARLAVFARQFQFSPILYLTRLLLPVLAVTITGAVISVIFACICPEGTLRILFTILISCVSVTVAAYLIGLEVDEKRFVIQTIKKHCGFVE